jgi:hypothetical protein
VKKADSSKKDFAAGSAAQFAPMQEPSNFTAYTSAYVAGQSTISSENTREFDHLVQNLRAPSKPGPSA